MATTRSILEQRVTQFELYIVKIETKIDNMLEKVEHDEEGLSSGQKGSVTKWRNKIKDLEAKIIATEAKITALNTTKDESSRSSPSSSGGGDTKESKALKAMIKDFSRQKMFTETGEVAVFTQAMQMLWNSHVKYDNSLELDFVTLVEGHICTTHRIELQRYVE